MLNFLCTLDAENWIDIVAIIVNVIIGTIVVVVLSKRISDKRALKDYLIGETDHIREDYRIFLNDLLSGKKNARNILSWFQVMNIRLGNFEQIYKSEISSKCYCTKDKHVEFREFLTDHDDFNNAFTKDSVEISPSLRKEILKLHGGISKSLMDSVISINKR
ncbi:hypothetical protein [Draconibacterium mangrovi]|uniref:hypothetical protein n=1 Tax=Draconibacterium mangrovi TaxID=2697469 RepID=UPI0013D73563|nr:hypothetical protein [Draconibacterium mangrovi]